MSEKKFSLLTSALDQPTQLTLQIYAQVLGKIRRALTPARRHWAHVSLRVGTTGLTTTPIAAGPLAVELRLDLLAHKLIVTTSRGDEWHKPLFGQSAATFCQETLTALAAMGIHPEIDRSLFADTSSLPYDRAEVGPYWLALTQIDAIFKQFKGTLRGETSAVQLWPHHIDLAFLWFTGRHVPGYELENEEYADEQMNFGFSPGDTSIHDPYFYITAYPTPEGLPETALPDDAIWHTASFQGAIMMYEALVTADNPEEKLLDFMQSVQQAAAGLMK